MTSTPVQKGLLEKKMPEQKGNSTQKLEKKWSGTPQKKKAIKMKAKKLKLKNSQEAIGCRHATTIKKEYFLIFCDKKNVEP